MISFTLNRLNVVILVSVAQCHWLTPTDIDDLLQCNDGSFCDKNTEGWNCCDTRQGRMKCPKNQPNMCADTSCSDNTDHCCKNDCTNYGGDRECRK